MTHDEICEAISKWLREHGIPNDTKWSFHVLDGGRRIEVSVDMEAVHLREGPYR